MKQTIFILVAAAMIGLGTGGLPGLPGLANPFLTNGFDYNHSLAITLILLIPTQLIALRRHLPQVHRQSVSQIVGVGLIGYVPGTVLLYLMRNSEIQGTLKAGVKMTVACLVVVFALYQLPDILRRLRLKHGEEEEKDDALKKASLSSYAFCIVAGFITIVAHVSGPLVSLFLVRKNLPPKSLTATVAVSFLFLNLFKIPILWILGHYDDLVRDFRPGTSECGLIVGALVLAAVLILPGMRFANWFNQKEHPHRKQWFRLVVVGISIVVASVMLWQLFRNG